MTAAEFTPADRERFWSKVDRTTDPSGCWLWTAGTAHFGYGAYQWRGQVRRAHRVAYVLAHGAIPEDRPTIRHRCDRPQCCNPAHLVAGTNSQNVQDRQDRHRQARGECHGVSVLTADQVRQARRRVAGGASVTSLAAEYGVSTSAVGEAVRGVTWQDLDVPPVSVPPRRRFTADEKADRLAAASILQANGLSQAKAAKVLHLDATNLRRWSR